MLDIRIYALTLFGKRVSSLNFCFYQHLQSGAKWFLKGFNSPSLRVWLAPRLEGAGIYTFVDFPALQFGPFSESLKRGFWFFLWNIHGWQPAKKKQTPANSFPKVVGTKLRNNKGGEESLKSLVGKRVPWKIIPLRKCTVKNHRWSISSPKDRVLPLPNGRTRWLKNMRVILTTYLRPGMILQVGCMGWFLSKMCWSKPREIAPNRSFEKTPADLYGKKTCQTNWATKTTPLYTFHEILVV